MQEFAQGKHFYLAVRAARERLQGIEGEYPCASWLPVICQNPAAAPLMWLTENQAEVPPATAPNYTPVQALPTEATQNARQLAPTPRTLERGPRSRHVANLMRRFGNMRWVILMVVVIMIIIIIHQCIPSPPPPQPSFSSGEKPLVTSVTTDDKKAGVQAFAGTDYETAIKKFQASLREKPNDPETRIYLNNAIARQNGNLLKIAVGVPIGKNPDVAQEILRGVSQKQNEVNQSSDRIKGQLLEVVIGNDNNSPDMAVNLANQFVNDPTILAVVGHNASDVSMKAMKVYHEKRLVMISPTSSADSLSDSGDFIFSTVPKNKYLASALASHIIKNVPEANIAFCGESLFIENESFKGGVKTAIKKLGGKFTDIACDLSAKNFSAKEVINQALKNNVNGLVLYPYVDRIANAVEVARANKEVARANKRHLHLFGSLTLYRYKTLQLGREDVNCLVLSSPWHYTLSPSFDKQAQQLWQLGNEGHVSWRTVLAYDATEVLVTGLKKLQNNSNKREELHKQLQNDDFLAEGVTGTIQFDSGDRKTPQVYLIQVQQDNKSDTGNNFVLLESNLKAKQPCM